METEVLISVLIPFKVEDSISLVVFLQLKLILPPLRLDHGREGGLVVQPGQAWDGQERAGHYYVDWSSMLALHCLEAGEPLITYCPCIFRK